MDKSSKKRPDSKHTALVHLPVPPGGRKGSRVTT